jgi:hypothetical protein
MKGKHHTSLCEGRDRASYTLHTSYARSYRRDISRLYILHPFKDLRLANKALEEDSPDERN